MSHPPPVSPTLRQLQHRLKEMYYDPKKAALRLTAPRFNERKHIKSPRGKSLDGKNNKADAKLLQKRNRKPKKAYVDKYTRRAQKKNPPRKHPKLYNETQLAFGAFGRIFSADLDMTTVPEFIEEQRAKEELKRHDKARGDVDLEAKKKEKTMKKVAVKVVKIWTKNMIYNLMNKMSQGYTMPEDYFLAEINCLRKLRDSGENFALNLITSFKRRGKLFMITELCSLGDLAELVHKSSGLLEHNVAPPPELDAAGNPIGKVRVYNEPYMHVSLVRFLMAPIFSAIYTLNTIGKEKGGYVHRDIKAQNILITKDGTLKLADFGTVIWKHPGQLVRDDLVVGSSFYFPPEAVVRSSFTETFDTWLMAVTMLVLAFGFGPYNFKKDDVHFDRDSPFPRKDKNKDTITKIFRDDFFPKIDKQRSYCQEELFKMLSIDSDEFPGGEKDDPEEFKVTREDWRDFRDFMKSIFIFHPAYRPNAQEICTKKYIGDAVIAWRSMDFKNFTREKRMWEEALKGLFGKSSLRETGVPSWREEEQAAAHNLDV